MSGAVNLSCLTVDEKTLVGLVVADVAEELKAVIRAGVELSVDGLDIYKSVKRAELDIMTQFRASARSQDPRPEPVR